MDKYTAKYFRESMPAWKKKKDSFFTKLIYRPLSFYFASFAANRGISANDISYFSAVVAVLACGMFLINSLTFHVIGSLLMMLWIVLDCTDGNLARGVKKMPFGEFADSLSSYILVGLMGNTLGFASYVEGGLLIQAGNPWIILAGAIASSSDTLMRLIHQKYKNVERKLADQKIIEIEEDFRGDQEPPTTLKTVIEREFGLGIIMELTLVASLFKALDLVVLYSLLYFGGAFVVTVFTYVRKAVKRSKI